MPNSWFSYTGTVPSLPSSYTELTSMPACFGTASLCAIYATVNVSSKPIITATLLSAINSQVAGGPTPVTLGKGGLD